VQVSPGQVEPVLLAIPAGGEAALVRQATFGMLRSEGILTASPLMLNRVCVEDVAAFDASISSLDRGAHSRGGGSYVGPVIAAQVHLALDTLKTASFATPQVRRQWMIALARDSPCRRRILRCGRSRLRVPLLLAGSAVGWCR